MTETFACRDCARLGRSDGHSFEDRDDGLKVCACGALTPTGERCRRAPMDLR